jgi:hypothetical protein
MPKLPANKKNCYEKLFKPLDQSHLTIQDFVDWVQIQTDANHQYFYANAVKMYEICPN